MLFQDKERPRVFELIAGIHERVQRQAQRILKEYGLTYPQFGALLALTYHSGLIQRELAQILETDSTTAMVICNNLEEKGLIRRERVPSDKRVYQVEITFQGRDIVARAKEAIDALYGPLALEIRDGEVKGLIEVLERIYARLP